VDDLGALPAHYAAGAGSPDMLAYLLALADPSCVRPDRHGRTLLHYAAASASPDTLVALAPWLAAHPGAAQAQDADGRLALHYAAQVGSVPVLRTLLERAHKPASVHAQDANGFTPVLLAAHHGHFDAVAAMLQFAAPPPLAPLSAGDAGGEPRHALLLSAEQGLPVVLAWLLAFSASAVRSSASPARALTVLAGLSRLQPPQVNCSDAAGLTPMHFACAANNENLVQLLNAAGSDVGHASKDGTAPLHNLAATGAKASTKVAQWLVAAGAPANARTAAGSTPLHLAASSGAAALIPILAHAGCPVNGQNKDGSTALMLVRGGRRRW